MEKQPQQAVPTQLAASRKNWNRRWMVPALLACATLSTNSYALLMSQDSSYGTGSITVDTDTGIQWLDPWLAITAGGGSPNSFNDVKGQFGAGGLFEGFRYATRLEVNSLLFGSAGIDANTSQNTSTSTASDSQGIAYVMSFFDTTFETPFSQILDAVFDDGANGADRVVLGSSQFNNGSVQFSDSPDLANNYSPYGHWLIRDNSLASSSGSTPVDEPQGLLLFGFALAAALGLFRNNSSRSATTA